MDHNVAAASRRLGAERGASLVEFALVLPILFTVVLGLFSGGLAYHQKLTITNAAREAGRYGATLPVSDDNTSTDPADDMTAWLDAVRDVAVGAATGELDAGIDGQYVCVAYVYPDGTAAGDLTIRRVTNEGSTAAAEPGSPCFGDGRPDDERRVQVRVGRRSEIETLAYNHGLTLRANSITIYERAPGA